jgi:lysozyme
MQMRHLQTPMTSQARKLAAALTALAASIQAIPVPGYAHTLILGGLLIAGIEGAIRRSRITTSTPDTGLEIPAVDGANQKASSMKINQAGLNFIGGWEGIVLHPYNDSAGNATIGIGHLIHTGPVTQADLTRYQDFTAVDAYRLLAQDVRTAEDAVRQALGDTQTTQNQWNACVDITYNCGPGPIQETAHLIKAGNWNAATERWQAWDHAGGTIVSGLQRRRAADRELALTTTPQHAWEQQLTHLATTMPDTLRTPRARLQLSRLRTTIHQRVQATDG